MRLSLTAVTANRQLGKTMTRLSGRLAALKSALLVIDAADWTHEILQIALVDRPGDYVEIKPTPRGSNLLQIAAGLPVELLLRPEDDERFLDAIAEQTSRALKLANLPEPAHRAALEAVVLWRAKESAGV